MLGKFLCMNSPVTILTSLRLDWSWCVTRKQNQAKAKPFKFIFKSFFRRSKTGLSRRFPIEWLTLDKRKVHIWDSLPVPNLVFSPPPPEFVRAGGGADQCTLTSKENFLASISMEASRRRKFRYIHLLLSAYSFTYSFCFDFYSCLLPCFLCTFSNEDVSVSTNYFCSCIVTDIH